MKKTFLILLLCVVFCSCKRAFSPDEKKLWGRWMTSDEQYNREWYTFYKNGSFKDIRFANTPFYREPEQYAIKNNQLLLSYKAFILLKTTWRYQIIELTDSTLTIATKATKKYPSMTYHLRKMKLHGKFIEPENLQDTIPPTAPSNSQ